jgi:hypothetical protein
VSNEFHETFFDAKFSVVKTYNPALSLSGNITNCKFFRPDMNLLNKAFKSTKGVGFIPLSVESQSPDVTEIDFYKSKRRFFVCVPEKLDSQSFFKPADICVVVSNSDARNITDIVMFNGQSFVREETLWNLYLEKTDHGAEKYSLHELLDFASQKNDNAPKKHKYLTALLEEIAADGIFTADSAVSLYDNVIVGRKQSAPSTGKKPPPDKIDEINRGNIAKIFGELITLIEKDKRENISCTLPYSHKPFTMPQNLYLIGTMNTSDRSIALLDTALRRRFAFIEINPDVSIVERVHPTIGGNVSPSKLLQELNNRITEKIDRDHRIGHSYFLGDDLVTKYDLFSVWYYKVLPLMMEYFYNDVKQVSEIVGKEFFDTKTGEIIQLSLKPNDNGISAFEASLMAIYESRD